uniref:Uncharacterized protein n=1 Tax=viral metagenome TaxID=1070528 RepID=A0A6M3LRI0_9ZZZZ
MNSAKIKEIEKRLEAGTELEKAYLNDYLENKRVPEEYLKYCRAWEKAFFERENLIESEAMEDEQRLKHDEGVI